MSQYQPLHDTFNVLAGGGVRRAARPGERFERPEKRPAASQKLSLMRQLFIGVWLKLQR